MNKDKLLKRGAALLLTSLVLLLLGAAATETVYHGKFVGNGGSLTNDAGEVIGSGGGPTNGITQAAADLRYAEKTNATVTTLTVNGATDGIQTAIRRSGAGQTNPVFQVQSQIADPLFSVSSTGAASTWAGFFGLDTGLTNASGQTIADEIAAIPATVPASGGTFSGPVLSTSSTTNSPSTLEFATAGWARSLLANGKILYNGNSLCDDWMRSTNQCYLYTNAIPPSFTRVYATPVLNQYLGAVAITNFAAGDTLQGPIVVDAYIGTTGGSGGPAISLKCEIYTSSDHGTNLIGDWETSAQAITIGATNRYTFVVTVPVTTFAQAGSVYRVFKVTSVSGATRPSVVIAGGTTWPSSISYNQGSASAATFAGPLTTNMVTGTPTTGYAPVIKASGAVEWGPMASGGGGGTNSGPITLSFSDTNVAVNATTPVGCVTNAPLKYRLTLSTNALFSAPTGMLDGQEINIELIQDATGGRSVFWATNFVGNLYLPVPPEVTTNASITTLVKWQYSASLTKWILTGNLPYIPYP